MVRNQTRYGQWLAVLVSGCIAASCGHHKKDDSGDDSESTSVSGNGGGSSATPGAAGSPAPVVSVL